ncbi:hypothetical protein RchiOBHm_Chr2g0109171 [Rosa chinensis]|uniref:Uncharacterized protein n=1 Tax=Rosa chinensis TaxID=74649 RepID=A0A2P6RPD7_ROSCH|nr:hypothetical protein RchiOBHm_Chr2g0109171 [Rosa chinensis]
MDPNVIGGMWAGVRGGGSGENDGVEVGVEGDAELRGWCCPVRTCIIVLCKAASRAVM